jgi:hypothetical protein
VAKLGQFAKEVTRVSQEVGTEGFVRQLSDFASYLTFSCGNQEIWRTGAGSRRRRHMAQIDRCSKQISGKFDVPGNVPHLPL